MEAKLTAYEARNKQCLFRLRIKRPRHCYFPGSDPYRRGKASAGQLFETFFGPQDRLGIGRVEIVSGISRVIHHDLGRHQLTLLVAPTQIGFVFNATFSMKFRGG